MSNGALKSVLDGQATETWYLSEQDNGDAHPVHAGVWWDGKDGGRASQAVLGSTILEWHKSTSSSYSILLFFSKCCSSWACQAFCEPCPKRGVTGTILLSQHHLANSSGCASQHMTKSCCETCGQCTTNVNPIAKVIFRIFSATLVT